ncbi:hypothetical protein [Gordonia amicalis]|uniref:hypothetical protein n=1 Tax=Gordonia amicalis TaxID=89053 RepID=UPI0015F754F2|nr:hypothetical protein [Gordonia amicalis]MBA5846876.1 hypothetical protein [Gordonia amicalis]
MTTQYGRLPSPVYRASVAARQMFPAIGRGYHIDPAFVRVIDSVIADAGMVSCVPATTLARRVLAAFCADNPGWNYSDPHGPLYYRLPAVNTLAQNLRQRMRLVKGPRQLQVFGDSAVIPVPARSSRRNEPTAVTFDVAVDPVTRRILCCSCSAAKRKSISADKPVRKQ